MPPVRTSMSSIKPVKTERTHEENQERAYIAASRRSDRSLEARVESARRASEIHKRRTGRSLRVTEQDVINEEMYEEEDDDLPMQYRRLTAHLQTQNVDFNRRLQAYLVNQVAMRQAVGNATVDTMQMGNQGCNPQAQFMNPGFMQMQQQAGMQGSMMPPQMYTQTPQSYRQHPYQMPRTTQNMRHNYHEHSASISTPAPQSQQVPQYQQQHSQSSQNSPVDARQHFDYRRMSLPVKTNNMPRTPVSQQGVVSSPGHISPAVSRTGSSANLASSHSVKSEHPSPQQVPTPPQAQQSRPELAHYQSQQTSPFSAGFEQQMMGGVNPLSMQLPMNAQQQLFDAPCEVTMPQMFSQYTQPGYSYNPNGKPKAQQMSQASDLSQTLTMPSLDTSFMPFSQSMTSPQTAFTDSGFTYTPQDINGLPFGDFTAEPFKMSGSGLDISGQVTPSNEDWSGFLQNDDDFISMAKV
ncbi:hypothetical protein LTR78_002953 [Recurvomyces mirabilis]|uniref:Uncharacterized protein n=1 Tax=Recurvomyces mirabilis TaxID=574656 RepID=A0AAE0WSS6_9PEZI|nr:hypothetical protein LTR78_002953 [Recurvomyces mirabilis]KAK5159314.1 hypothetical protein LTS14_002456 [Recurvomyces mirabilis]